MLSAAKHLYADRERPLRFAQGDSQASINLSKGQEITIRPSYLSRYGYRLSEKGS